MPQGAPGTAGPPRSSFLLRRIRPAAWFAGILTLLVAGSLLKEPDGPYWGMVPWWGAILLIPCFFGLFLAVALFLMFKGEAMAASEAAAAGPEREAPYDPADSSEAKGPPLP